MMNNRENQASDRDISPEIAADDVGASAAAERLQKIHSRQDETARTPIGGSIGSDHQQMDRSNDPVEAARMDDEAAAAALSSRHERLAGSAVGVGSGTLGFADPGVFTSPPEGEDLRDELLIDGQEEVFSRSEVERGRIEHHAGEETLEETGDTSGTSPRPERDRSL